MRIVIANSTLRRIGGTEDYLNNLVPALCAAGHELAFTFQEDEPKNRARVSIPDGSPAWDASELGVREVWNRMGEWKPDLIYAHGLLSPELEDGFFDIAPSVYFTHNYYGTCISGMKTCKFPTPRPCNRIFGPACLAHYFPRRCGGKSPITMLRLYLRETRRKANLRRYKAIVTHSSHMRREYIRNGFPEESVENFLYEITPRSAQDSIRGQRLFQLETKTGGPWRLLFVGRMEMLKGGSSLLDSLVILSGRFPQGIQTVFAGDGPQRAEWQRKAVDLHQKYPSLTFEFPGWIGKERIEELYQRSDLLVVPSLWPEPFGRIGPEAGLRGLPVAAFAVGGITDWLEDGVNGFLARQDPPSAAGLAEAIVKCLEDSERHAQLRKGAEAVASRFNMKNHMEALNRVFHRVCAN